MKTRILVTQCFVYICMVPAAYAMNDTTKNQLQKLDLSTRLEQRCDIEAMERLAKDTKYSPDKVLAYAFSDPVSSPHQMQVKGGAFRAKGNWYHLSYKCNTDDSNMKIISFKYKIGNLVPKQDWNEHYLVP